jgi:3-dehydrosphinganine reductase
VTLISRSIQKLEAASKAIDGSGRNLVQYFSLDLAKATEQEVKDVLKKAEKEFGPIEVFFNNAGFSKPGLFLDNDAVELAQKNMELNFFGAFKAVHAAAQLMASRKRGRICLVGSVCSFFTFPGFAGYGASKFALRALADSIKYELATKGITVHLFMPSTIDTPGLKIENESKPKVTWDIEGKSELITAEDAARVCLRGMIAGRYYITTEWLMDLFLVSAAGPQSRFNPIKDLVLAPAATILSMIADWTVYASCKSNL